MTPPIQYYEKPDPPPVRLVDVANVVEPVRKAAALLEPGEATCEIDHTMWLETRTACVAMWALVMAASSLPSMPARTQLPTTVDSRYAAPPGRALLVFTRPRRRQASEVPFRIVDRAGKCLAVLRNGVQAVAPVWPGKQMLMVVTGSAPPTVQLLLAKMSAGKTYIVRLGARVNVKNPAEIEVVRREDQPLEAFPAAIRETLPVEADLRRCTEWVSWKRTKIEPRAERAKRAWDEADDVRRNAHTIRRNDGWTASEVVPP